MLKPDGKSESAGGDAPAKKCDECDALVHAAYRVCPECGFEFPKPEKKHAGKHSQEAILSGEIEVVETEVDQVFYRLHTKRNAPEGAPQTMKVTYYPPGLNVEAVNEWICVEHEEGSYPQRKAATWWRARSNVLMPKSAAEAVELANEGALAEPSSIKVEYKPGERFPRIVAYELGEIPSFKPWHDTAAEMADKEAEEEERRKRFKATLAELDDPNYSPPF
jgi:DNA repair protein RadD